MSAPYSIGFYSPFPNWKFMSSSLVLEKESTAFLASQTVGSLVNDSSDLFSTARSLEDKFFGNIEPLKDPATGKYNKTLQISTNPMKSMENLITTYGPETTPYLDPENNSWTDDYWFSGSVENSSFSTELQESEISDRDETISTTQVYSDGSSNTTPTRTTTRRDENSTPLIGLENTSMEGSTDGRQSFITVNSTLKNFTHSITIDTTSPVTFPISENVTSYTKLDNATSSSNSTTGIKNSTPAVDLSTSTIAEVTNLSHNTIPVDNGGMYINGSFPSGGTCSSIIEGNVVPKFIFSTRIYLCMRGGG